MISEPTGRPRVSFLPHDSGFVCRKSRLTVWTSGPMKRKAKVYFAYTEKYGGASFLLSVPLPPEAKIVKP